MRLPTTVFTLAMLAAAVYGCSDLLPVSCSAEARPAITVEARDSITHRLLTDSAQGYVVDGSYRDTLQPPWIDTMGVLTARAAAYERAGTYTVHLSRPGYHSWTRANVTVNRDRCHVVTVPLTAWLQPAT